MQTHLSTHLYIHQFEIKWEVGPRISIIKSRIIVATEGRSVTSNHKHDMDLAHFIHIISPVLTLCDRLIVHSWTMLYTFAERYALTNLRAGVRFEMQMSVSHCYKPPECRRHPARSETTTLSSFPFSVRRWEKQRGNGEGEKRGKERGKGRRRISGLNYQTGYPQRKPSEAVPSSPLETRIEMVKIEIGRSESGYSRALSRLSIALADLLRDIDARCVYISGVPRHFICVQAVHTNQHPYLHKILPVP